MTLVMFGAVLVDRPALSVRNLAIAAIIVLAREPEALLGPSFQMSFGAVAALAAFVPMLQWGRSRRSIERVVGNRLAMARRPCAGAGDDDPCREHRDRAIRRLSLPDAQSLRPCRQRPRAAARLAGGDALGGAGRSRLSVRARSPRLAGDGGGRLPGSRRVRMGRKFRRLDGGDSGFGDRRSGAAQRGAPRRRALRVVAADVSR